MSHDVTIGRCGAAEIVDVLQFIDEHWAHGHVLATCRPLLDWQHREADGTYSIIVARRSSDRAVVGMLGYIPTRRFDAGLADENVVWLTTWRVRDDAYVAGLGLALLQHLRAVEPHVAIGAIGLNPATTPIYEALGYRVGELQHYVRPNATMERFELAAFAQPRVDRVASIAPVGAMALSRENFFERVVSVDRRARGNTIPQKTPEYFHARYLCHPLYSYVVVALVDRGPVVGLLATRVAEHAGRRALRIVDFLGHAGLLERIGDVVQSLLEAQDAEYADVYNVGIDPQTFERAGFTRVDPCGADVVPDHFEPFERRNVRLSFSIKGAGEPVLFKGDADQDRPSIVRSVPR
jgi:hypothetical protein